MLRIFRSIRLNSLQNKKFTRYISYAVGEILLVTIGILIALQINNWNNNRLDIKKERSYLKEIKENLNEDLVNIQSVLDFNSTKRVTIDSTFYYLSKMRENKLLARKVSNYMPVLSEYATFKPNNVAFNNMVSSGNIDLIRDENLRKNISKYYTLLPLANVQDQIKETTKEFLDIMAPALMNREMLIGIFQMEFNIRDVHEIDLYKNEIILSDLFVMQNKMLAQNKTLTNIKSEVQELIESIDEYRN